MAFVTDEQDNPYESITKHYEGILIHCIQRNIIFMIVIIQKLTDV